MLDPVTKGNRLSGWLRRRELASDRRAGHFSRAKAVKLQRAWLRRNWRIALVQGVLVAVALPLVVFLPGWSRGLAAGAWCATGLWLVAFEVVLATGTAPQVMGDRGEQLTASELRRLRRHGWRVINHVALREWDIDHIAVGPGGVLVVETKWSAAPWTLDADVDNRVGRAVDRIAGDANRIRLMFPNRTAPTPVIAALVLWGGYNPDDLGVRVIGDVTVIRGAELRDWLHAIDEQAAFIRADREHVWSELDRHVRKRDAADLEREGPPSKTSGDWMRLVTGVAFTTWLGVLLSATAWTRWRSFPIFFFGDGVLVAIGLFARQRKGLKPAAFAWLVSVLFVGALVAVAAIFSVL
jgi:hypothetical protein